MKLLGHKAQLSTLEQELASGTGMQSYLFSGPRAIGKFQTAVLLAQAAVGAPNFEASEEAPYPSDVSVLQPSVVTQGEKTKSKSISVEEVRAALQFLTRYPSQGRYRVLIIRDAHTLAPAAQNMILKTLEEPPSSAILILVTHEPGALLETVRSRVSEKIFAPVASEELTSHYSDAWLSEHGIPPFFRTFGRPGVLEAAASHPEQFQKDKELLSQLYKITKASVADRLALADELAKDVPKAVEILEWWLTGLRAQALQQTKKEQSIQFYAFLKSVFEVIETLKTTQANARLLLEQLFFQIR